MSGTMPPARDRRIIRVIDFESTDNTPEAHVIEAGWTDLDVETYEIDGPHAVYVRTDRPVTPGARGVHHISDAAIASGIEFEEMRQLLLTPPPSTTIVALAAHNIDTERTLLPQEQIPWICTLKCAYVGWPDAPEHKNQTLRYWLDPDGSRIDFDLAWPPHRGGPDSYVTAHLLRGLFDALSFDQMLRITLEPTVFPRVPIGEDRGKPWSEADIGFLKWIVKKPSMDPDIVHSARLEIERRQAREAMPRPAPTIAQHPMAQAMGDAPPEAAPPPVRPIQTTARGRPLPAPLPDPGALLPARQSHIRPGTSQPNQPHAHHDRGAVRPAPVSADPHELGAPVLPRHARSEDFGFGPRTKAPIPRPDPASSDEPGP